MSIYRTCHAILKYAEAVAWQRVGAQLFLHHGRWLYMHFARWIQKIYWRTSLRRDEAKYFYRRISSCGSVTCSFRKDLLRICVFPSHLWVSDITELIKQLLKLYEALTERYSECVNWLEEDRNDNIVFDVNLNPSTKAMQGQEQGRGLEFLSRKPKD